LFFEEALFIVQFHLIKYILKKLPPVNDLSNRLQNLWLLCHEASKQTKSDIEDNPTFDVNIKLWIFNLIFVGFLRKSLSNSF